MFPVKGKHPCTVTTGEDVSDPPSQPKFRRRIHDDDPLVPSQLGKKLHFVRPSFKFRNRRRLPPDPSRGAGQRPHTGRTTAAELMLVNH